MWTFICIGIDARHIEEIKHRNICIKFECAADIMSVLQKRIILSFFSSTNNVCHIQIAERLMVRFVHHRFSIFLNKMVLFTDLSPGQQLAQFFLTAICLLYWKNLF